MSQTHSTRQRGIIISLILGITLVLDLVTKQWARTELGDHVYAFLGNSLIFEHSENPGAFLSLGASLSPESRFLIFTVGIAAITLGVLYYVIKNRELTSAQTSAYTLIVAGGFGNLFDRVMKQSVTDFINVGIGSLRTGIFNIADMAIMLGVFMLFYFSFQTPPTASVKK